MEEILYPAMEDHVLDLMIGEGPSARSIRIDLAPFTLVAATTRAGLLATPLRDRFGIPDPAGILHPRWSSAVGAGPRLGPQDGPSALARRRRRRDRHPRPGNPARGRPAAAPGPRLRRRRRRPDHRSARPPPPSALARLDVDPRRGWTALDRRYLRALIENYGGGPAGVETLAYAIAEARDAVEDVIEPYLMQQGFIQRTPRGRVACAKAYEHLGLREPPKAKAQPGLFEED